MEHITITNPDAGSYRLALTSETSGTHVVTIHAYSSDGSSQPEVKVPIESNAGERAEVEFSYSPVPGSVPEFVRTIEFSVERGQVNLGSHGVITIVIPSTETFDASTVDPLSIRFGPAGASEAHQRGHLESGDLVLHFRVDECGLDAAMTSVCLTGQTLAGKRIRGCAPIHLRD